MYENKGLHIFANDDEIHEVVNLWPMVQTLKKELIEPVHMSDDTAKSIALGYGSVIWDEIEDCYKLWYCPHGNGRIYMAVSKDGYNWDEKGLAVDNDFGGKIDTVQVIKPSQGLDSWFSNARYVGTLCRYDKNSKIKNVNKMGIYEGGIHVMRSMDGQKWEVNEKPVLPGIGDRSSLAFDPVRNVYMFMSRPPMYKNVDYSKIRKIALWESYDLINFEYKGIVLRADLNDEYNDQLYGMQPLRYGNVLLGLLELYHASIERLDTQLAVSRDGYNWNRVLQGDTILTYGGEGSWDSHWVVPTLNSPIIKGGRLMFFYSGASTKHASGIKHRRAFGIASLRKDGWVSMEAGRKAGKLVTKMLEIKKPMKLSVNVSCPNGYFSVEVLKEDGEPLPGYEDMLSKIEGVDDCCLDIKWNGNEIINAKGIERCMLKFTLYQGSFYSYTWSEA